MKCIRFIIQFDVLISGSLIMIRSGYIFADRVYSQNLNYSQYFQTFYTYATFWLNLPLVLSPEQKQNSYGRN